MLRLSLLLVLLICVMCRKPEACVEPSGTEVLKGDEVQFNDCSKRADEYILNYGDGSISKDPNAPHVYERAGHVIVELRAENKKGDAESIYHIDVAKFVLKSIRIKSQSNIGLMAEVNLMCNGSTITKDYNLSSGNLTAINPKRTDGVSLIDVPLEPNLEMRARVVKREYDPNSMAFMDKSYRYVLIPETQIDVLSTLTYPNLVFTGGSSRITADVEFMRVYEEPSGNYP